MGASTSSNNKPHSADPTEHAQLIDETGQCQFYRDPNTGMEYQKYRVENNGSKNFQNKYEFRLRNRSPYLVDAYYARASQNAFGCTSSQKYQVVTERIPSRLSTIQMLPIHKSFHYLRSTLKGFHQLYKSLGLILVKDSMIGFNKSGKVKVWLNQNFAVNSPEPQPLSYKTLEDQDDRESMMVDNIIQLINSKSERMRPWVDFIDEKYYQGRLCFEEAVRMVSEYIRMYNIPQPEYLINPQERILDEKLDSLELHNHGQRSHLDRSKEEQKSFRVIDQSDGIQAEPTENRKQDSYQSNSKQLESAIIYHKKNPLNTASINKPNSNFANVRQKVTGVPQQSQRFIQHYPPPEKNSNIYLPSHHAPPVWTQPKFVANQPQNSAINNLLPQRSLHMERSRSNTSNMNISPQPRIQFNSSIMRQGVQSREVRSVSEGKPKVIGLASNNNVPRPFQERRINFAQSPNHGTNQLNFRPNPNQTANPLNLIQPHQLQKQFNTNYVPSAPNNPPIHFNQQIHNNPQIPQITGNSQIQQISSSNKPKPANISVPLNPPVMMINSTTTNRPPTLNNLNKTHIVEKTEENVSENRVIQDRIEVKTSQSRAQINNQEQQGQDYVKSEENDVKSDSRLKDSDQIQNMVQYNEFYEQSEQGSPTVPPAPLPSPEMQSPASVKMITFAKRRLKNYNQQERGQNQINFGNFGNNQDEQEEQQEEDQVDIGEDYSPLRKPKKIESSSSESINFGSTLKLNKIDSLNTDRNQEEEQRINELANMNDGNQDDDNEQNKRQYSFSKKDYLEVDLENEDKTLLEGRVIQNKKEMKDDQQEVNEEINTHRSVTQVESMFASQSAGNKTERSMKASSQLKGPISYKDLREMLRSTRTRS